MAIRCAIRCIVRTRYLPCRDRYFLGHRTCLTTSSEFGVSNDDAHNKQRRTMNKQLSSQALTSGSYSNNFQPDCKSLMQHRVTWIGLHPLEMVDRIMSMTKHSSPRARSAANSIDAVSMISATTPPLTSKIDARCESLVDSILNKRNGATKEIAALPSSVKGKNGLFQSRMENWLIQNWTNPFPDTTALNVLATQLLQAQCIVLKGRDTQVLVGMSLEDRQCYMMKTAVKKIETYLTNTRLRKWRKSIEDAFDLVRNATTCFSFVFCYFTHTLPTY